VPVIRLDGMAFRPTLVAARGRAGFIGNIDRLGLFLSPTCNDRSQHTTIEYGMHGVRRALLKALDRIEQRGMADGARRQQGGSTILSNGAT